jgi:glucose-6-phosphate isomerase
MRSMPADPRAAEVARGRTLRFLANVDPVDVARATAGLDPEETLVGSLWAIPGARTAWKPIIAACQVVVVSKTFTTAETMLNARTLRKWLVDGIKVRFLWCVRGSRLAEYS